MNGFVDPFAGLASAAGKVVADGWTAAMLGIWNAGLWLLRLAETFLDSLLTPDLSETGPGAWLYRVMFWIAGALLLIMALVQLGTAVIKRDGKGLARVAIGLGQFSKLNDITAQRRKLAKHYFKTLGKDFEKQTGAQLPPAEFESTNWHLFQVVLPERITRPEFMEKMKAHNIGIGFHYAPIHLFKLYRALGFKEHMFPVAERVGKQIVSLPMFYAMNEKDVERTCAATVEVLAVSYT